MRKLFTSLLLTLALAALVVPQSMLGGSGKVDGQGVVRRAAAGGAAWIKGFNFRATSGYVTDGANETYVLSTDTSPTVRNSVTFQITSASGGADRDSGLDRRLAGLVYKINDALTQATFTVTLPSTGSYTTCLAVGDATNAQSNQSIIVKDSSTTLFSFDDSGTSSGSFDDTAGTEHTAANWAANNVCHTDTFATTTFNLFFGDLINSSGNTTIAHVQITKN